MTIHSISAQRNHVRIPTVIALLLVVLTIAVIIIVFERPIKTVPSKSWARLPVNMYTKRNVSRPSTQSSFSDQSVLGKNTSTVLKKPLRIVTPENNAHLVSSLPFIKGTGIAGSRVSWFINAGSLMSGATVVEGDGIWQFTAPRELPPGKHTLTVTSTDGRGKPVAVTHAFTIFKSGSQVLGEATPSATITDAPTPSASASLQPTVTPTTTPTPTPPPVVEPVPRSGSTLPAILFSMMGIGLVIIGALDPRGLFQLLLKYERLRYTPPVKDAR